MELTVTTNGTTTTHDVEPRTLLVHFVRDTLGLKGTNVGCDTSSCGACTIHVDGESVKSCTVLAVQVDGSALTTIEGLAPDAADDPTAPMHPMQEAFREHHGLQCGFCTPGMMITARALLDENPDPTEDEIREAISGQICRCTGYTTIVRSIQWAAKHGDEPLGRRAENTAEEVQA